MAFLVLLISTIPYRKLRKVIQYAAPEIELWEALIGTTEGVFTPRLVVVGVKEIDYMLPISL